MLNSDKLGIIRLNDETEVAIALGAGVLGAAVSVCSYLLVKVVTTRMLFETNIINEPKRQIKEDE